jgi:hypothetical protein
MLLGAVAAAFLMYFINKIRAIHSIIAILFCGLLIILAEGINVLLLSLLKGLNANEIFSSADAVTKTIYGLPSLFIFGIVVLLYYLIANRRKKV